MFIATISNQRSGTKLLGSLLGSSGAVLSVGEVFNPDIELIYSFKNFLRIKGLDQAFNLGSQAMLEDYLKNLNALKDIVHFDLMFNQIEHTCISWSEFKFPFIYSYMKAMRISVILLTRDPQEIYVSNKLLELSGLPHSYAERGGDKQNQPTIRLRYSEFLSFKENLEDHYALVRKSFAGYDFFREVDYSFISREAIPEEVLASIQENAKYFQVEFDWRNFLPLSTHLVKKSPDARINWEY